ncbi:MAG: aldehyde dehydrogenase family protein [Deltaproteobacteria bacterium]|nr:aldehyde dehydrogenase family protein [Deltaproteobacteria bacterium]MCB9788478.1 aldehyde dehydrogenase family protein [Deltaproteobacteria bacterium]
MAVVEPIASKAGGRRRLQVKSPVDLAPLGEFDVANAEDVAKALTRARKAQSRWALTSLKDRAAMMDRLLGVLLARQDAIVARVMGETGRSRMETFFMEIFAACDTVNFHARRGPKILADQSVGLHLLRMKKAKIVYRPLGVVGIITPWNGPFILSLNPTVQAVMAGNAVIIKPSEVTPFSGQLVEDLFREAEFPEHLVQVLLGDGETGAALCEAGVDKISFTGSVATGRKVGETCGRNLIPCTLELGGKDPMLVCADADLERAAGGAVFGAFMNAGQYCSSTERVYVVDAVADRFTDLVVEKTRALKLGTEGDFDLGPFIASGQIDIVERHVADAVEKGARVLCGGKRNEQLGPYFYEPTVLTGVTHAMAIVREESFGPLLPIIRCDNEEEAVRMANDTTYGLGANVWSRDKARAERIGRRMDAGSVCINDASVTYGALEVPFGGRKSSGVGSVNGAEGLRAYCHAQPIITDRFGLKAEQIWYPYTQEKLEGMQKALKIMWGSPLKRLMK